MNFFGHTKYKMRYNLFERVSFLPPHTLLLDSFSSQFLLSPFPVPGAGRLPGQPCGGLFSGFSPVPRLLDGLSALEKSFFGIGKTFYVAEEREFFPSGLGQEVPEPKYDFYLKLLSPATPSGPGSLLEKARGSFFLLGDSVLFGVDHHSLAACQE